MSNQGWIISLYHYEHETLTSSSTSSSDNNYGNWKVRFLKYLHIYKASILLLFVQKLATVGEETMDTPVFLQMDSNQVYLVTDHLSKFALIGESTLGRKAVKTLRLVAFSQAQVNNPTTTNEYTIRVYVLDDTTAALEVCTYEIFLHELFMARVGFGICKIFQHLCVSLFHFSA